MKITKFIILFLLLLSLIACGDRPSNINKQLWNESKELVVYIDECINSENCVRETVEDSARDYITKFQFNNKEEEKLSLLVWDLYLSFQEVLRNEAINSDVNKLQS